jgi:hypothetical protein
MTISMLWMHLTTSGFFHRRWSCSRRLKTRFFTRQIFRDVRYVSMSEASNHPYYRLSTIGKHNHAKLVDQNCRLRVPLGFLVVLKWRDHVL